MFERYTEQARRVLFFARYESSQLGHLSIGPEHLLLGLLRENARDKTGIASRICERHQISLEDLGREIQRRFPYLETVPTQVEIPFGTDTRRLLDRAAEEADRLQHAHIGAEHLLLGLLRDEGSIGAVALISRGLQLALVRQEVAQLQQESARFGTIADLTLKLSGYTDAEHQLFRNVLLDRVDASLPKEPQAKVQIYNAEIAPGGYTNWHCHNGATFFIALQGRFEAEFEQGLLITARAGDVYSEPIGAFHRGHNPHPDIPYLCIGVCITPPDREHVTNVDQRPW
ncbi:MAG: Clp protease N-terminal domain-containing protein [Acidobacteriota bacterium]